MSDAERYGLGLEAAAAVEGGALCEPPTALHDLRSEGSAPSQRSAFAVGGSETPQAHTESTDSTLPLLPAHD